MKPNLIVSLLFTVIVIASCSKNDSTSTTLPPAVTSANSSWKYEQADSSSGTPIVNNYTLTSTTSDTTINGKTYHIYTNSDGGFTYRNISGNDYYQFDSLPAGIGQDVFERLYLKDNGTVGTSWTQILSVTIPGVPVPLPVTLTNNIVERDISRVVNGVTYNNVIHVSTSLSSALIPAASLVTAIDSYYAPNYGLIENTTIVQLNYVLVQNVNIHTRLISADLK